MKSISLFKAEEQSYSAFRIPTLLKLPSGRILAFCEGRVNNVHDWGEIHILCRSSEDGGISFGDIQIIARSGKDTIGNPSPVYDKQTGKIHMLLNGNLSEGKESLILQGKAPRFVYHMESADEGKTWSPLRNITNEAMKEGWTWHAVGPCHAIQLKNGRLLFPCNHAVLHSELEKSGPYISHAMYSDDHGFSWNIGSDIAENTNECSLAELADSTIYMNMRSYLDGACRAVAYSKNGGKNWINFQQDYALPDPICQGSVLFSSKFGEDKDLLFCSNLSHTTERKNLEIKISLDAGKSWIKKISVSPSFSAYSDLAQLDDCNLLCLYECGKTSPYEEIRLATIPAEKFSAI